MFSANTSTYNNGTMLNICDEDVLGRRLSDGAFSVHIKPSYYGGSIIAEGEAERLLRGSAIINMVGKRIVSLATGMGLGSPEGVRVISGVPFLIVIRV